MGVPSAMWNSNASCSFPVSIWRMFLMQIVVWLCERSQQPDQAYDDHDLQQGKSKPSGEVISHRNNYVELAGWMPGAHPRVPSGKPRCRFGIGPNFLKMQG